HSNRKGAGCKEIAGGSGLFSKAREEMRRPRRIWSAAREGGSERGGQGCCPPRRLFQLDRPVGVVEEGLPGLVLAVGQLEVEHRAALGLLRLADQRHRGLLRRPPALLDV